MDFANYMFVKVLLSGEWLRQKGLIKKRLVVDSTVADGTLDLLLRIAMQIGSDALEVGIKLLYSDAPPASGVEEPEILAGFQKLERQTRTNMHVLQKPSEFFEKIWPDSEVIWDSSSLAPLVSRVSQDFQMALWVGLTRPRYSEERIKALGRSPYENRVFRKPATFARGGLRGSDRPFGEILQEALAIVLSYEKEHGKLEEAPKELIDHIDSIRSSVGPTPDFAAAADLIEEVNELANSRLVEGPIENVFRASLFGGINAAIQTLELDEKLSKIWGDGSLAKTERLVEVWASTIALTLLKNEPDQQEVLIDITKGFGRVVFDSDPARLETELRLFREQLVADEETRKEGGIPTYAYTLLRLRCIRALGREIDFEGIQVPIQSVAELIGDVLDPQDGGLFLETFNLIAIHATESVKAQEALQKMDGTRPVV